MNSSKKLMMQSFLRSTYSFPKKCKRYINNKTDESNETIINSLQVIE